MSFDLAPVRINIFGKDNWTPQFKAALNNTKRIGKQFTSVGKNISRSISAPALLAGGAMFKMAADFEFAMQEVKALTSSNDTAMESLSVKAQELGIQTKFSATEAANGMALLGRAGWNTNQIMQGTEASLNLAAATNMDLARTAEIVANTMGAFEEPIENVTEVTDILAAVTASSNINLEQFSESMKDGAAMAHTYGLTVKEAAVMTGFLGNMGIKGTKTGTAFKNVALSIVAPTKNATRAFKILGITTMNALGEPRKMTDIFTQLSEAMKPLTKGARLTHLKDIFGRIPAAAVNSLVNDMSKAEPKFFKLAEAMKDTDGWAKRMAVTMNTGATGEMRKFKSAVEGLSIALMDKSGFLSNATKLLSKITDMVRAFAKASPATMQLTMGVLGLAAVLGPLTIGVGLFVHAIGAIGLAAGTVALGPLAALSLAVVGVSIAVAKFYDYVNSDQQIRAEFDENPFGVLLDWVDFTTAGMKDRFDTFISNIGVNIQAGIRTHFMESGALGQALVGFSDWSQTSGVYNRLRGQDEQGRGFHEQNNNKQRTALEEADRLEMVKQRMLTNSSQSTGVLSHTTLDKSQSTIRVIMEGADPSKTKVVQEEGKAVDVEFATGPILAGWGL